MHVKVEVYSVKVGNIVIKVVYLSSDQAVVEVSRNLFKFASGFKSTVLLLLPVDPNSFLPLVSFSFKHGEGLWIITEPSVMLEDGSDSVVCLGSSLHVSYSEAETFNPVIALTSLVKYFTINLLFRTDIQSNNVVLNEEEGQV